MRVCILVHSSLRHSCNGFFPKNKLEKIAIEAVLAGGDVYHHLLRRQLLEIQLKIALPSNMKIFGKCQTFQLKIGDSQFSTTNYPF